MKAILSPCAALVLSLSQVSWALPPDFERIDVVGNLKFPQTLRAAPDGRFFLGTQSGEVIVVKDGRLLPAPFAKVKVWAGYRESMTGLALDPDFAANGRLYLYHYADVDGARRTRISRFTASKANPDVAEAGSETVILDSICMGVYVGGALFFGKDGMLYVAGGYGGSQNPAVLGGKVLRINARTYPDVVPPDNPFAGQPGKRGEIWALGFREAFSGAADPVSGDIIINDVGESRSDELNLLRKGANYGFEAGCEGACDKAGMENPWVELLLGPPHRYNCVTGGAFYHGWRYPAEYRGAYFFGDWGKQRMHVRKADGSLMVFDSSAQTSVIQLEVGPDGYLYMLKLAGNTGTLQRLGYKGTVGLPPDARVDGPGRLGPDAAMADRRTRRHVAFATGGGSVRHARVHLWDARGSRVASLSSSGPEPLRWDLARAPGPGAYFYSLRVSRGDGTALSREGRILLSP